MKILVNGNFHTLDPRNPTPEFLAIDHGCIVAAGSIQEADTLRGERINLNGATVLPGLTDSHIHLHLYSQFVTSVQCETDTLQQTLDLVKDRANHSKPGQWILGTGWNQNVWPEGFGTAKMLDEVAPENPVYLTSKSIHSAWVNSSALQLAGITRSTKDPENGVIQRDDHGEATGILFEEAMGIVEDIVPPPSVQELSNSLETVITMLHRMGLTGAHNFDRILCFQALQALDIEHKLNFRVLQSIPHEALEYAVKSGLRSGFGSNFLKIGPVKIFMDGALGPHTAAMIDPYEGKSAEWGILFLDDEQVFEIGQLAAKSGLSIAAHAIGDNANHMVLGGLQMLREYESLHQLPNLPHRIEHVQLLHPSDLNRLSELNIIASMQPIHATSDMIIADDHWGDRAQFSYAWNTLLQRNTKLIFGSDAPVETANPFHGIHAAVTRQRTDGYPGGEGWYPAERLSLNEALAGYTYHAAEATRWNGQIGRLGIGYFADLIVLERNPFAIPPSDLHTITPSRVMVDGEWVVNG